ncbi:MAG: hypothetical protein HLUCCX14_04990 [Marinobacter excellens HL-55]|uniref:Uncharacterized protein n=1 Tax=Marinobacter excellens HL-55 TaxID=1305731 RepID=A0A0P7YGG6_9GAMM|nr:MAG: hypothetical protein HLUCCX14_04990 [Marinobacter excellens HL-55]
MTELHHVRIPDNEIAAPVYLSWVAYPEVDQREQRSQFVRAAVIGWHKKNGKRPPEGLRGWQKKTVESTLRLGFDRINKRRVPASWMYTLRSGIRPGILCNQHLAACAAIQGTKLKRVELPEVQPIFSADKSDPINASRLCWRESLPALPMILALPLELAGPHPKRPLDLLYDMSWPAESAEIARSQIEPIAAMFGPDILLAPFVK